jgi:hypothetical protein
MRLGARIEWYGQHMRNLVKRRDAEQAEDADRLAQNGNGAGTGGASSPVVNTKAPGEKRWTQSPSVMTSQTFWLAVARLGGHLGRRGDGPLGWKTLWKGWLRAQTLLEGVHLAAHFHLKNVYKSQV